MKEPERLEPDDPDMPAVPALIRESSAYMNGRIDPPSSMHPLTLKSLARHCSDGEIWIIGRPVPACLLLSRKPGRLYLGKLAATRGSRSRGPARCLIGTAAALARARNILVLEPKTRVELTGIHAAFAR